MSVQLSWDLPDKWKRNGKIIGYKLSYLQVGSSAMRKVENLSDKRTFVLGSLKKFTSYKFWIRAKTQAGEGPASEIKGMTKEDGKQAVQNVGYKTCVTAACYSHSLLIIVLYMFLL